MIDINLADEEVNLSEYKPFNEKLPTLFLGFAIKNEYDNRRLKINESYRPIKTMFLFERRNMEPDSFNILPLYGLFLNLNKKGKKLAATLLSQDLNHIMGYRQYETILEEFDITCHNSYSYLNKRIYPIDFKHLDKISSDSIVQDKKILQHLLELDEHEFDFQKFGSFKLLILV